MVNKQKSRNYQKSQCLNCGARLTSRFCCHCGQKNKDYHLSFKDLFSDFIEELLDFDSRVLLSLRKLFTRPGFLTSEYVKGRRVSYLPPVRIYLFASVVFFLALSLKTLVPAIQDNTFLTNLADTGDLGKTFSHAIDAQADDSNEGFLADSKDIIARNADSTNSGMSVTLGESSFDMNQSDFLANFSDNFAKMMFFLLPVAALQLKVLYWRRKKLYIEHLIFSVHVHAFIFCLLILTVMIAYKVVMWGVILWSMIYLYLAMKNYYGQSHPKTLSKMFLLLLSYGATIMLVMTLTLVATAVGQVLGI